MSAVQSLKHPVLPEGFREQQRAWLKSLGILDKPWLILGSAPSPTLPPDLLRSHARIDVNNAGRTAQMLGLGAADLTIRKKNKSWAEHPTLETRGMLWYHTAPLFIMHLQLLMHPRVRVKSLMRASKVERDAIVELISKVSPRGAGETGKATNGVAAICYAIFVGIPEIVLAGLSLSKDGHSYDGLKRTRRQVSEDRLVLTRLKDHPNLLTTEVDLARDVGIKLWEVAGAR